jgi:glucokinase
MSHPPVVLGLDFGGTKIAAAVCDLAGNKLASVVVDSLGGQGARASFDHGIAAARELLRQAADGAPLAAVGVATFGIPFEDRVELAPAISGWATLPLGRVLRAAFPGARIQMATDAKAAARAEARWGALAGYDPAVYLNLGTGLAAAIVTGSRVLTGRNGAAGEIGYSLRELADVSLAADRRILLEDMVSGQALQRRAGRSGQPLTAAEVFAASESDPELDELVSAFVRELAFHVVNLAILVDPARIAVGGGMVRSWDRIRPVLEDALGNAVPYPPELVLAHFPHDAPLLGAVAMAVDIAGDGRIPVAPGSLLGADGQNINQSNGHTSTKSTMNASSRPQGDPPAGPPLATSPSGACPTGPATPAGTGGQDSPLKG